MAIQLSTAGVTVNWATATDDSGGPTGRPTSDYTKIPEIKSVPELNPEPDSLETTPLEEPEWHTYIPGLKDTGGALPFTANLTEKSMEAWEALVSAYDEAAKSNKDIWFCIIVPGLSKSLYFTGQPSPMGMPAMEVSSVLETTLYITPTNAPAWLAKPSAGV